MNKVLKSSIFFVGLIVVLICYALSYVSSDLVLSDKVYGKYLDQQYQLKYYEYKQLDLDLSDFEDELAQFDSTNVSEYDWESFYIDSIFILAPMFILLLGYSCTFLITILFHKNLQHIKFGAIIKCTLLAYPVFYLIELLSAFYFLPYNIEYRYEEIVEFQNFFYVKNLFEENGIFSWLRKILAETNYFYFVFPLVVALLLKVMYPNLKKIEIIGNAYLAYTIIFLFYNTVFWYLFDLT